MPRGLPGHLLPAHPVRGAPDVVQRVILRDVIAAAEDPDFAVVDDQTSLLAPCPGSRPLNQPPMSHMRSLKTSVIGRSLCFHGAFFVTSFQVFPLEELQTSRGGAVKESNQPPRIQSWSLKTTSP